MGSPHIVVAVEIAVLSLICWVTKAWLARTCLGWKMAKKWSAAAPCRSGYTPRCHGFASFVVAICVAVSLFRGGNVARGEEECGNCSPSRSPSAHDGQTSSDHGRNNDLEDHAFLLADYYKRLHRPELSLAGWQKVCVYVVSEGLTLRCCWSGGRVGARVVYDHSSVSVNFSEWVMNSKPWLPSLSLLFIIRRGALVFYLFCNRISKEYHLGKQYSKSNMIKLHSLVTTSWPFFSKSM